MKTVLLIATLFLAMSGFAQSTDSIAKKKIADSAAAKSTVYVPLYEVKDTMQLQGYLFYDNAGVVHYQAGGFLIRKGFKIQPDKWAKAPVADGVLDSKKRKVDKAIQYFF